MELNVKLLRHLPEGLGSCLSDQWMVSRFLLRAPRAPQVGYQEVPAKWLKRRRYTGFEIFIGSSRRVTLKNQRVIAGLFEAEKEGVLAVARVSAYFTADVNGALSCELDEWS